jgi:hypothetical protein
MLDCVNRAIPRQAVDLNQLPGPFARQNARMIRDAENTIEIRVNEIAQLFHTLDPFPFREKDLDREAEEYIVGWARELPTSRPFRIIVHIPQDEAQIKAAGELREAFSLYFAGRAAVIQGDLNELFRIGRRSLSIGVAILFLCLLSAQFAAGFLGDLPFKKIVEESFLILGWVANWRPLEIFLYDWWPIAHRRDLYRRLSAAAIDSRPYPAVTAKAAV